MNRLRILLAGLLATTPLAFADITLNNTLTGETTKLAGFAVISDGGDVAISVTPVRAKKAQPAPKPKQPEAEAPAKSAEYPRPTRITTVSWPNNGSTQQIRVPAGGSYSEFTTTGGRKLYGDILVTPAAGYDFAMQRVWISDRAGGAPLPQYYTFKGEQVSACLAEGREVTLKWTQGRTASDPTTCVLQTKTTYYLHHAAPGCEGVCYQRRTFYHKRDK